MVVEPYDGLRVLGERLSFESPWLDQVRGLSNIRLQHCEHGDLPRWLDALGRLPESVPYADLDRTAPRFGRASDSAEGLAESLMALHPWRKGPLEIAGLRIETEWRSDWKWARIAPYVNLTGQKILDIGCGNGYFGWRMLASGAELVIGVDPTWVFVMQWQACRHFGGDLPNFVLPLAIEDLPGLPVAFDTVFSMGVLYHRRDPLAHLEQIRTLLCPEGDLVLETLVLPEADTDSLLEPQGRYARMRNVWAIPGCNRLLDWVERAGFRQARIADVSDTTVEEQRSTAWMTFESLDKALDPADPGHTIEGHPAPRRAVLIASAGR